MHFDEEDIENLDKVYRINLINSCSGYKSANLIGSVSKEGVNNLAIFSSITHLGSNPPLLGFFLRPTEIVPRHTYLNIKENSYYTINSVQLEFADKAHHTSAKYDREISEFDITKIESENINNFPAPYVKSSSVKIGMKFVEEIKINYNRSRLIVGKIVELNVDDNLIGDDGFINLSDAKVATISGCDGYSFPKSNSRKGYQKPKKSWKKHFYPKKYVQSVNFRLNGEKSGRETGRTWFIVAKNAVKLEEVNLIFPNQLFEKSPLFDKNVKTFLIEEYLFFKHFKFHKKKIFFHRVSMKKYYDFCLDYFDDLEYIDSYNENSDIRVLLNMLLSKKTKKINYIDPCDNWLNKRIKKFSKALNINIIKSPQFLNSNEENLTFFNPDKKNGYSYDWW